MTLLRRDYNDASVEVAMKFKGRVRVMLADRGPIGPSRASSGSSPYPLSMTRCTALELSAGGWRMIRIGDRAELEVLGEGSGPLPDRIRVRVDRGPGRDGNCAWR